MKAAITTMVQQSKASGKDSTRLFEKIWIWYLEEEKDGSISSRSTARVISILEHLSRRMITCDHQVRK